MKFEFVRRIVVGWGKTVPVYRRVHRLCNRKAA